MTWQEIHDGLFWPRYAPLVPGRPFGPSLSPGKDAPPPTSVVEDFHAIAERLKVLRS